MIYPLEVIEPLRTSLAKKKETRYFQHPVLPSDAILIELLEVAYHASFLTEEGRKLHFRIIYASQEDLGNYIIPFEYVTQRHVVFDSPREFSISEILRLAPALDMTQVLICVSQIKLPRRPPKLVIWGMLDSGSSWWNFMHHQSSHGSPPPNHITISCTEPGNLSISSQGQIYMTLRNGALIEPTSGALYSGPLSKFFDSAKNKFYKDVLNVLNSDKYGKEGHDENYPKWVYTFFIERLLFTIREKAHGGTIFFVPDYLTHNDTRLLDRIDIKYPINYNEVWNLLRDRVVNHKKYYDLHFTLSDGDNLTAKSYNEVHRLASLKEEIDETTSDCVRFIAGLSCVDGAVVITDRFRVLGFGAEVLVHSPNLTHVTLPGRIKKPITDYGTRHRSAFRFCSSFEESVGFIVSSDGGVKATRRTDSDVTLWPDINVGVFGI